MAFGKDLSGASLVKLISFVFWTGLYIYSVVSWPDKSFEWNSRLVTLLHGVVATIVGLFQCGLTTLTPCRLSMKITSQHYALMVWSWGYFAFDLLWCLLYWLDSPLMLCHHTSALIAISIYMRKAFSGCTFACNIAMMEITNPLLQTRWFLKYEGYDKTTFYYIVEVTYLVLFLFVRGVLGTYIIFKILTSKLFDPDEKVISLVFYFVSLAFIYDIMGYVLYRYKTTIDDFFDTMGYTLKPRPIKE